MKKNDEVYEKIIEAVKKAEANLDMETDMRDANVDKASLEQVLVNDDMLKEQAKKFIKTKEEPVDYWDSYFFPGEDVLFNKLGIHSNDLLKKVEYEIVARKIALLYLTDDYGNFSVEHLKDLHKYLFEDIYPFAGKYRLVNMGKADRASFMDYRNIDVNLHDMLDNIDSKVINRATSKFLYAEALANLYKNLLDFVHPFREGNGRTIREFLREYVVSRNVYFDNIEYELDFNLSDEDKVLLEEAIKMGTLGNLVILFNKMLKEKVKQPEEVIKKIKEPK